MRDVDFECSLVHALLYLANIDHFVVACPPPRISEIYQIFNVFSCILSNCLKCQQGLDNVIIILMKSRYCSRQLSNR
jgi:hypothetical protein